MINIQRDIFPRQLDVKPQTPMPVIDQTGSQFVTFSFTAGTDFTVSAGSAGQTLKIQLPYKPILGNFGQTGSFGNSSIVLGGGLVTTLGTEVAFIADTNSQGGNVSTLSNGQYMVDYENALIYCKRGDNGTSGTIMYSYWVKANASSTAAGENVNIVSVAGDPVLAPYTGVLGVGLVDGGGNQYATAQTTPTSTFTGFPNDLPWAIFHTTPTTRTNGQGGPVEADSSGNIREAEQFSAQAEDNTRGVVAIAVKPLAVSTYSWTSFQNLGANATLNVKASSGNVFSVYCHNIGGTPAYFQLHNTATTPAGGATPAFTFLVPSGGTLILDGTWWGANGQNFATGIAFAFSTTETTYTAGTAANQTTQILYN